MINSFALKNNQNVDRVTDRKVNGLFRSTGNSSEEKVKFSGIVKDSLKWA